jgi:hypothetical protein
MAQHASGRRRAGAAAAAGLVVLAAAVVVLRGSSTPGRTVGKQPPSTPAAGPSPSPSARLPVAYDLLDRTQVRRLAASRRWTVSSTSGAGLGNGCQERRFADSRGYAALVRTFRAAGDPARSAIQTVEVSRSVSQAHRAYRTTLGWYAGCRAARV